MLSDTLVPTPAPVLVAPPAKVPLKPTRSGRVRFLPPQLQNNLTTQIFYKGGTELIICIICTRLHDYLHHF